LQAPQAHGEHAGEGQTDGDMATASTGFEGELQVAL
jgi:hypothetical protein